MPKIQVTFEIDVNNILHVSALEESTQNQSFVSIKSEKGRLSSERIAELVAEAEQNQERDKKRADQICAKNALEKFLLQLRQMLVSAEVVEKIPLPQRTQIDAMVTQNLDWIAKDGMLATTEQLDSQRKQIETALEPVLGRLYQSTGVVPGQADGKMTVATEGIERGASSIGDSTTTTTPSAQPPPTFGQLQIASLGPPYGAAVAAPTTGGFVAPLPPAVATKVASIGPSIIYTTGMQK